MVWGGGPAGGLFIWDSKVSFIASPVHYFSRSNLSKKCLKCINEKSTLSYKSTIVFGLQAMMELSPFGEGNQLRLLGNI